jgi:NAD(P)-dependent dehydrogenase (short-subunit alcohol dehydrogenase family)
MKELSGKIAVVTGGGSGMGRELVRLLVAEGCHVAMCDVSPRGLAETLRQCTAAGLPQGVRITSHVADVSKEADVLRFLNEITAQHATDRTHLLFNNAGISGGGSLIVNDRAEWERTFNICWGGVYHCTRAFLPLLRAADEAHIVNTSSINGFWASVGPDVPHTSYSAAKFAVKGFTEALIADFRINAPHQGLGRDAGTHRHWHSSQFPQGASEHRLRRAGHRPDWHGARPNAVDGQGLHGDIGR